MEIERSKLGYNLTKITLESFLAWKKKKIKEKQEQDKTEMDRKKAEFKAGKNVGLSGREMFTFNPDLARDSEMGDDEAAMDIIRENDENDTDDFKEIDIDEITKSAKESDDSGTQSNVMNRKFASETNGDNSENCEENNNEIIDEPIDESLFMDEVAELENELESVKI